MFLSFTFTAPWIVFPGDVPTRWINFKTVWWCIGRKVLLKKASLTIGRTLYHDVGHYSWARESFWRSTVARRRVFTQTLRPAEREYKKASSYAKVWKVNLIHLLIASSIHLPNTIYQDGNLKNYFLTKCIIRLERTINTAPITAETLGVV